MKRLLKSVRKERIICDNIRRIVKTDINGQPFYCLDGEGHLMLAPEDSPANLTYEELTYSEWGSNEININSCKSIICLLEEGLAVVGQLRRQMKKDYKGVVFDIVLIVDKGTWKVRPSVKISFYMVRNNFHFITSGDLEKWKQPILISEVRMRK